MEKNSEEEAWKQAVDLWKKLAQIRGVAYSAMFAVRGEMIEEEKAELLEDLEKVLKETAVDFPNGVDWNAHENGEFKLLPKKIEDYMEAKIKTTGFKVEIQLNEYEADSIRRAVIGRDDREAQKLMQQLSETVWKAVVNAVNK